jgi:hypothetical protein
MRRASHSAPAAEDLIVMKAFAGRPQDHRDIRGVLVRQGTRNLDWKYIVKYLSELAEAKEQPEIVTELLKLRDEVKATEHP